MIRVNEKIISDWQELERVATDLMGSAGTMIYRGQKDARWGLTTSLHRAFDDFGISASEAENTELGLFCRVRRQAHHYERDLTPTGERVVEWLSLMQHHGAPTRLQDWTYSFYVALYFALESASGASAVWVMRRDLLLSGAASQIQDPFAKDLVRFGYRDDLKNFTNTFANKTPLSIVCPINPYKLNERITLQCFGSA